MNGYLKAKWYLILLLVVILVASCETKSTQPVAVNAPQFSPVGGTYLPAQMITISYPKADFQIRYTQNGEEPSETSTLYTDPLILEDLIPSITNTVTLRATAFKTGADPSQSASAIYFINYSDTLDIPTANPSGGNLQSGDRITLSSSNPEAEIHYTLDNSEPTHLSPQYIAPIRIIQAGTVHLKAKSYQAGWNPSSPLSLSYEVDLPALDMQYVEGGTFNNGIADVILNGFYIDKYEVSQKHYYAVMNANIEIRGEYPAYYLSWFNAIEYCNRRSILEGYTPCYTYSDSGTNPDDWQSGWDSNDANHNQITCNWNSNGYRLPTEMQWMFAARGGNQSQDYIYSGGNDIHNVGWCNINSNYSVHQIALKEPNELGIYDMSGNLWEWCWDIYGSYPNHVSINPTGAAEGNERVLRGGSWYSAEEHCKLLARNKYLPSDKLSPSIGFRCIRIDN